MTCLLGDPGSCQVGSVNHPSSEAFEQDAPVLLVHDVSQVLLKGLVFWLFGWFLGGIVPNPEAIVTHKPFLCFCSDLT